jgi:hypothetical protein
MALEDTPILGNKPNEQDEEFCKACDELKERFNLGTMVVAATPKVPEDSTEGKELIYICTQENPFYLLETSVRLIEFHVAKEFREFQLSKEKALGMLGMLEKIVTGRMNKKEN